MIAHSDHGGENLISFTHSADVTDRLVFSSGYRQIQWDIREKLFRYCLSNELVQGFNFQCVQHACNL